MLLKACQEFEDAALSPDDSGLDALAEKLVMAIIKRCDVLMEAHMDTTNAAFQSIYVWQNGFCELTSELIAASKEALASISQPSITSVAAEKVLKDVFEDTLKRLCHENCAARDLKALLRI
jgi:hypothetical protein